MGLWTANGGSSATADIAAAIAQAESGGCQYALAGPTDIRPVKQCTYRKTDGEESAGLWQINHRAHPETDLMSLFDPNYNAAAAVRISSHGSDFTPWTTFTSGAYLGNLTGASLPPPRHAPRVQHSPGAGSATPAGIGRGVFANWSLLMHALGATVPSQTNRTEQAARKLRWAIARPVRRGG